jgi:RNA polymerase-binding transcription factor DksA
MSPNAAGLTAEELRILRDRLERLRAELRQRLVREEVVVREAEQLSEPMDAAEQTREQDDAVLATAHARALLRDVEHALAKLDDSGRYGLSEVSGRPIGFRRLLVIPWARLAADEAEVGAALD